MAIEEALDFEYNPSLRWEVTIGFWLSLGLTGFLFYLAVFARRDDPEQMPWFWGLIGGMAISTAILLWVRRLLSPRLSVSPEGVSPVRHSREVVRLSWQEITGLRRHRLFGWVEIESAAPEKRIRVDRNLVAFADFVAILESESGIAVRATW